MSKPLCLWSFVSIANGPVLLCPPPTLTWDAMAQMNLELYGIGVCWSQAIFTQFLLQELPEVGPEE